MNSQVDLEAMPDATLKAAILRSLELRDRANSVCPSEIARSLAADSTWRPLMPRIRRAAAQLVREKRVIVTRGTKVLSVEEMEGGPIRIRRGPQFENAYLE